MELKPNKLNQEMGQQNRGPNERLQKIEGTPVEAIHAVAER